MLKIVKGLLAFVLITVVQVAVVLGFALLGYAIAEGGLGAVWPVMDAETRNNLSVGFCLAFALGCVVMTEILLKGTKLNFLRWSQNPILLLNLP